VTFAFARTPLLGGSAELFWLSDNATERWYASLPAGLEVTERTYPGQCWRARDATTGNHLLSYCATLAPSQTVAIAPAGAVRLDFHFSPTAKLAPSATVVEESAGRAPTTVGTLRQGGTLSVQASAGARYRVVEGGSGKTIARQTASHEAEQHVDIGSPVVLRFSVQPSRFHVGGEAGGRLSLYWSWAGEGGFGAEHLEATLAEGETRSIATMSGERWIVRDAAGRQVRAVVAADAPAEQAVVLDARWAVWH